MTDLAKFLELWEAKNQEARSQRGVPRSRAVLEEVSDQVRQLIRDN